MTDSPNPAAGQAFRRTERHKDWDDPFVGAYFIIPDKQGGVNQVGRITSRRNDRYSIRTESVEALVLFGVHAPGLLQGDTPPFKRRFVPVKDTLDWLYFPTQEDRDDFIEAHTP